MIKLIRPKKPEELTNDVEKELVQEFKTSKKAVWRKDYITKPLAEMSNNKCCYCETKLGEQAKPMHVEHFHDKDTYPDEVVSWENLLPSCSQCNSNKGTMDTYSIQIINPSIEDPKDFLYLKFYMLKSKDNAIGSKGRNTVDELDLNNRERLINPRIKIAEAMHYKLDDIHRKAIFLDSRTDGKMYNKTRICNTLVDILKMAQKDAEYSAFMATIILNDEDYNETREILQKRNLWTNEMEKLHNDANTLKLDMEP